MLEIFTRTYIDESEFPHKVKTGILKEGEWVYEVRLVKEPLQDGDLVSIEPIEKLQIVKRRVDDTFIVLTRIRRKAEGRGFYV